ncbi:DUF6879 family protein [Pseudonocardia sp.]|uniref:DUF6879 family protein n=1 Tax=Pseudonocardia sp. TaxID=60912 RepID=UPI002F3FB41B
MYRGSGEEAGVAALRVGAAHPPAAEMWDWVQLIQRNADLGCVMQRVHLVTEPLGDCLRFELCRAYPYGVRGGEDVRIIPVPEGQDWPADVPRHDYWLYDSHRLVDMHYDDNGTWLGVEPVHDPARIVAANYARDAAWHHAIPCSEYVGVRPELVDLLPEGATLATK